MKVTTEGWAVVEGDTHISEWVVKTGQIDHGQRYYHRFREYGVGPGDTVVDIGAFIGDTTVPLADVVGREGRVYAFEPNPAAFACLAYNTRFHPQVKCLPYALGDKMALAQMKFAPNLGASHVALPGMLDIYSLIPMVRLDDLELNGVRFIKIDVEGYELSVIAGAQATIRVCRPKLMIETAVHGEKFKHDHRRALYNWLEQQHYTVTPHLLSLDEAPQYDIFAQPQLFDLTSAPNCQTT